MGAEAANGRNIGKGVVKALHEATRKLGPTLSCSEEEAYSEQDLLSRISALECAATVHERPFLNRVLPVHQPPVAPSRPLGRRPAFTGRSAMNPSMIMTNGREDLHLGAR